MTPAPLVTTLVHNGTSGRPGGPPIASKESRAVPAWAQDDLGTPCCVEVTHGVTLRWAPLMEQTGTAEEHAEQAQFGLA
jgi:hypothetical protein